MNVIPTSCLDALELHLELLAQLEVQGAQRLVQQQHARPVDQRAGERHALALAARELAGPAVLEALEPHHRQRLGHALGALVARHPLDAQAVGDVVAHRHVGEQRVVLEDRVDVALERAAGR